MAIFFALRSSAYGQKMTYVANNLYMLVQPLQT